MYLKKWVWCDIADVALAYTKGRTYIARALLFVLCQSWQCWRVWRALWNLLDLTGLRVWWQLLDLTCLKGGVWKDALDVTKFGDVVWWDWRAWFDVIDITCQTNGFSEILLICYAWRTEFYKLYPSWLVRDLSKCCWYDVHDETSFMRSAWLDVLDDPCLTIRAWSGLST
jgi:hypothetical protein